MKIKTIALLSVLLTFFLLLSSCKSPSDEKQDKETEKETSETTAIETSIENTEEAIEGIVEEPLPNIELTQIEAPSDEIIEEISADYLSYLYSELGVTTDLTPPVYVTRYYGSYNGAVPVKIESMGIRFNTQIWEEDIAGFSFRYHDGNLIKVWNDNTFCTLREAYDSGVLTRQDIYAISEIHKSRLYAEMNMNWIGNLFDKAKFAVSTMGDYNKSAISAFLGKDVSELIWVDPMDTSTIRPDGIRCYGHFGHGSFIFIPGESEVETTKEYLGYAFTYPTYFDMYFLYRDTLMSLEEAYELGYFTLETLGAVEHNYIVTEIYNERLAKEAVFWESNDFSDVTVDEPSEEIIEEMKSYSISFLRYYGNFDNAYVVSLGGMVPGWIKNTDDEVAGVIFHHYSTYYGIDIFFNGELLSLGDAYEMGIISTDQLTRIAYIHKTQQYIEVD